MTWRGEASHPRRSTLLRSLFFVVLIMYSDAVVPKNP